MIIKGQPTNRVVTSFSMTLFILFSLLCFLVDPLSSSCLSLILCWDFFLFFVIKFLSQIVYNQKHHFARNRKTCFLNHRRKLLLLLLLQMGGCCLVIWFLYSKVTKRTNGQAFEDLMEPGLTHLGSLRVREAEQRLYSFLVGHFSSWLL